LYEAKARALAEEERREPLAEIIERAERRLGERRSFSAALSAPPLPAIIAEIKRASPSLGLISRNFDPAAIAATYERAKASAISVLTEADHFLGDIAYLDVARAACTRPILRKDFLSTPYQVAQSAAYGADAILLIVAGLDDDTLRLLCAQAERFALDVLIEVHDEAELVRALALGVKIVGINNRDLRTFETDLGVTETLLSSIPPGVLVISESGVQRRADIARLQSRGAHGFLIGESLMRSERPQALIEELRGVATHV
jgi:indole-3-glycerol phosphate synthase